MPLVIFIKFDHLIHLISHNHNGISQTRCASCCVQQTLCILDGNCKLQGDGGFVKTKLTHLYRYKITYFKTL